MAKLSLAVFDFDLTLTAYHVFYSLSPSSDKCVSVLTVPPPHARTEKGQLFRLIDLQPGFALEAFGGHERVAMLRHLLESMAAASIECVICTWGYVGIARWCLEQVGLMKYFSEVFGTIGSFYGCLDYDKLVQQSSSNLASRFLGTQEDAGWGSKRELVLRCMQRRGLKGVNVVFVDDCEQAVLSLRGVCKTILTQKNVGIGQKEIALLLDMVSETNAKQISKSCSASSQASTTRETTRGRLQRQTSADRICSSWQGLVCTGRSQSPQSQLSQSARVARVAPSGAALISHTSVFSGTSGPAKYAVPKPLTLNHSQSTPLDNVKHNLHAIDILNASKALGNSKESRDGSCDANNGTSTASCRWHSPSEETQRLRRASSPLQGGRSTHIRSPQTCQRSISAGSLEPSIHLPSCKSDAYRVRPNLRSENSTSSPTCRRVSTLNASEFPKPLPIRSEYSQEADDIISQVPTHSKASFDLATCVGTDDIISETPPHTNALFDLATRVRKLSQIRPAILGSPPSPPVATSSNRVVEVPKVEGSLVDVEKQETDSVQLVPRSRSKSPTMSAAAVSSRSSLDFQRSETDAISMIQNRAARCEAHVARLRKISEANCAHYNTRRQISRSSTFVESSRSHLSPSPEGLCGLASSTVAATIRHESSLEQQFDSSRDFLTSMTDENQHLQLTDPSIEAGLHDLAIAGSSQLTVDEQTKSPQSSVRSQKTDSGIEEKTPPASSNRFGQSANIDPIEFPKSLPVCASSDFFANEMEDIRELLKKMESMSYTRKDLD